MSIMDLRRKFPHHDFYFFKDGFEMKKSPFIHSPIKSFEIKNDDTIFVEM